MSDLPLVVITGVSGYIGSWVAKVFLDSGKYRVRGTVRDVSNQEKLEPVLKGIGDNSCQLELVNADVLNYESLTNAWKGWDILINWTLLLN